MLPFLRQKEGGAAAPVQSVERKPDTSGNFDIFDALAEDLMLALETKNKSLLKDALQALCDHIMDRDQEQDTQLLEE